MATLSPSTNGQSVLASFPLDADTTYTRNMFLAQVRDSIPEVLATPGYSIVDISGGTTEIEADVKPIATVFSGKSDPKEYLRKRNTKLDLTMKMDHFYCERKSLEINKDEVYWSIASGADNQDKVERYTRDYGSVVYGKSYYFDSGTNFFKGLVQWHLAGHITAYEADDSPGGWYDKLQDFLKKASKKCIEASVDCPKNEGWDESRMDAKTLLALIGAIAALFDAIIGWIRNDDDLVEKKMFGWDRDALEGLLNYGGPQIFTFIDRTNSSHAPFYKLTIKSSATTVLLESPEGMVGGAEIIQYSGGTGSSAWSDKSFFSPFGPSEHGAVLMYWNKELYAFNNTDSTGRTVLTYSHRDPVNGWWHQPVAIEGYFNGGNVPIDRPAVTEHNGRLYCALRVTSNGAITLKSCADKSLSSWEDVLIPKVSAASPPILLSFPTAQGSELHCIVRGEDNLMRVQHIPNGSRHEWYDWATIANYKALSSPSFCYYKDTVYCCFRSEDNVLLFGTYKDYLLSRCVQITTRVTAAPALAVYKDRLWCVQRGQTYSDIWVMSFDGKTWSSNLKLAKYTCTGDFGLCSADGTLFCSYTKLDPEWWTAWYGEFLEDWAKPKSSAAKAD